MTISELIERLEALKAEHGDLPVYGFGCQDETRSLMDDVWVDKSGSFVVVTP